MENIKSKIIPDKLKKNIDEILEKQLFNANRYYAESNANISTLMERELKDSPELFLNKLKSRWNWHNYYYEKLLEPAFEHITKNANIELSPQEIDDLIKIYFTSCLVDEATLIMSGAIKKYLEYYCKNLIVYDENLLTSDAKQMLITPPVETFFAQYQIDHLYYIYMLKSKSPDIKKFKDYIKKKYHANDEIIFKTRFDKRFKKYLNFSEKELLDSTKNYAISSTYKTQHIYFTLEHPERKSIRDIIIYDNLDEKLIASNLIGISGFLLRRKILEYLNFSSILQNNGYIYEFDNDTVIKSLEILKKERKKKMDKDIHPYKQRGDTCAIACLMMTLEYYKIIEKANWHEEKRLYKVYSSKHIVGTPFSAVAYHLSKNGLDTAIYHSDNNLFNNDKKKLPEENYNLAMKEYKTYLDNAVSKGTTVIKGINIDTKLLKDKLYDGNIIILAGEIADNYHAILISGYNDNQFIVCDPLYKHKKVVSEEEIAKFMNTSIGKWFITINGKVKEKQKLMNSLDTYIEESKTIMNISKDKNLRYVRN